MEIIPDSTEITMFVCANCARPGKELTSAVRARSAVPDFNLPAGYGCGNHKCSCFNSVRYYGVPGRMQLFYTFDCQSWRAYAGNFCAHLVEKDGEV